MKEHYLKNKTLYKSRAMNWQKLHPDSKKKYQQKYVQKIRLKIIDHYTNGQRICMCPGCKVIEVKFLTLDHVNGDGKNHRKNIGYGLAFYRWIIENNFPKILTILCMNCNFAKGKYGICPHLSKQQVQKVI